MQGGHITSVGWVSSLERDLYVVISFNWLPFWFFVGGFSIHILNSQLLDYLVVYHLFEGKTKI